MKTNYFEWWNFIKRWVTRESPAPNRESPAPNVSNREMRVVPQWIFLEFEEKKPHTAHIKKMIPVGGDAFFTESKAERITAPPRTKQDQVELAIKPAQNLWVRALCAHPPEKYVDGLLRMEERYDWVIIQRSAEDSGQVGLMIISYGAQEVLTEFSTCAVIGHKFNDKALAKAVNPVLAEIIQRTKIAEARQPEIAAQIDERVDGLIAQLRRK